MARTRTSEKTDQEILQSKRAFMIDYATCKGAIKTLTQAQKGDILDLLLEYGVANDKGVTDILSNLVTNGSFDNPLAQARIEIAFGTIQEMINVFNKQYISTCRTRSNIKQLADQERKKTKNEN